MQIDPERVPVTLVIRSDIVGKYRDCWRSNPRKSIVIFYFSDTINVSIPNAHSDKSYYFCLFIRFQLIKNCDDNIQYFANPRAFALWFRNGIIMNFCDDLSTKYEVVLIKIA